MRQCTTQHIADLLNDHFCAITIAKPFTLPQNSANFHTENTVGAMVYTETIGRGFFGYAGGLYAGIE